MADYIVGLDFGSRSIKMVMVDDTRDPVVVDWDEELLALDHDPYFPGVGPSDEMEPDQQESGSEESGSEESAEGDPELRQKDGEAQGEGPSEFGGPSRSWVDALRNLLSRHDFETNTEFVTFLPDGRAISIHEEVPFGEDDKVKSILPNVLEDRLPIDPAEIVYDFQIIDAEGDSEHEAVIGLGRRRDIGQFLGDVEGAGLNPAILGIPELMMRYVSEAAVPAGETAAVVDIGHEFTRVIVLDDQGEPELAHSFQVGGRQITERIAQRFEVSEEQAENYKKNRATVVPDSEARDREEQALSEAIRLALRPLVRDLRRNFQSLYANKRIKLDKVYLCGGTSQIDRLEEYLTDQFSVPVEPLPVWEAIDIRLLEGGEDEPRTAMALSCALQMVRDRSRKKVLDLRKGEFSYRGRSSYLRSQLMKYGSVAAVLLLLFFGTLFAKKYQLEAQEAAMNDAVVQQTKELFGKPVTDRTVVEKIISGQSSAGGSFAPKMSAYQLYYELMSKISQDIELELDRIDVDIDRNIVQISGQTTGAQKVDGLAEDLRKVDCLKKVSKGQVENVPNSEKTRFRLEISSSCS